MDGTTQALVYFMMPVLIAAGAAAVTAVLMQAYAECLVSRQREKIAELRAVAAAQVRIEEERVRSAEEAARRKALDEIMADIRVEERQLARGRSLLVQERVFFRTIPLTGWIEHEIPAPAEPRAARALEAPRLTCP